MFRAVGDKKQALSAISGLKRLSDVVVVDKEETTTTEGETEKQAELVLLACSKLTWAATGVTFRRMQIRLLCSLC